ncbi:electron transfer flavoprotein subunit alpha/FixB family protein [Spirochaetota bacterium]
MSEIYVLAEHINNEIRDITFEMLSMAKGVADGAGATVTAVLLAENTADLAPKLQKYAAKVITADNAKLKDFNAAVYQSVLSAMIQDKKPALTMIGHTAFGMDLAPSLAAEAGIPLVTDCIKIKLDSSVITAERPMYGGKVHAEMNAKSENGFIVTISQGACPADDGTQSGEIEKYAPSLEDEFAFRKFVEYIKAEAGDVDITQSDIIISAGRGIKEQDNLKIIEELAEAVGGVVACSRPIVDAGWLPKDRQVGSSGKTVTPKLYIAIGISGSSQHQTGMKSSGTIVAINKDANAPIFNIADYGIVDDLFKVVPALKEKIAELKK